MKRVWNLLLPQIDIIGQCESLFTRRIIFENPPETTLGFESGTECSVTCDVVASLACYSYSKSIRLGGVKSVRNDYLHGDVTSRIFLNFQNLNTSASEYIFRLTICSLLYRYTLKCMRNKKKYTPLCSYIPRAGNVEGDLNV